MPVARGPRGKHGGYNPKQVGQRRGHPTIGDKGWHGGPPGEGFTKMSARPAPRPEQRPIAKPYKHLGRFATGKARKEYPRP